MKNLMDISTADTITIFDVGFYITQQNYFL